ncbi:hypothetical protein PRK78_001836 [Emydomyces testavorans]|uniref:Uncharacterized protein n=1 Tax=Emydomyces testavorans TaxID=2070801 RepID=A0AAF0DDP3_9EURO|nr:hypothetical protein PRK78_001836 [Emydomyces testavorans]
MAPNRQNKTAQNKGKQPIRNQGQNPTSTTPNQPQGSGVNKGKQPATPQGSQGAGSSNGNNKPASAGSQVPLRLRATMPGQPPRDSGANAGSQTTQSTSGSPAVSQKKKKNKNKNKNKNQQGRQEPTGPTSTPMTGAPVTVAAPATSSNPVAKTPSGNLNVSTQEFAIRLAAMREGSVVNRAPTGVPSGGNVDNQAKPVATRDPQTAPIRRRGNPVRPAPGQWATFAEQIRAHDGLSDHYVYSDKGLDITELDKQLGDSTIRDVEKLRRLREIVIAQNRILGARNKMIHGLEQIIKDLDAEKKQWQQDKESMQTEADEQAEMLTLQIEELEAQLDRLDRKIEDLAVENHSLVVQLLLKDPQPIEQQAAEFAARVVTSDESASATQLEGQGEIAKIHNEVGENGLEQQGLTEQVVDKSKLTKGDQSASQVPEESDEITSAGKGLEGDSSEIQHRSKDDNCEELEAQQAVERNLFVSLEGEGVFGAMGNVSLAEDSSLPDTKAPLHKVVDGYTQTASAASVDVVDAEMQTVEVEVDTLEASTQTVWAEDVLSETQIGGEVSSKTKDGSVQTEPVIISEGRWWRGFILVLLMLLWAFIIMFWGQNGEQQMWLEANTVSYVGDMSASPFWLQELRYNLSDWLQIDRVMLG